MAITRRIVLLGLIGVTGGLVAGRGIALAYDRIEPAAGKRSEVLALMRKTFKTYWDPSEAGGVFLIAVPNDDALNIAAFQEFFRYFPGIDQSRDDKWENLAQGLADVAALYLHTAKMPIGHVTLQNHLSTTGEQGAPSLDNTHWALDFNMWGRAPIAVPKSATFVFDVTHEHLALIKRVNARSYGAQIELMDAKRPYGDMSYFYIDMAQALGEPVTLNAKGEAEFSPSVEARYDQLHREMLFAIQAVWQHGEPAG